jgi:hydrogenase-4 component E
MTHYGAPSAYEGAVIIAALGMLVAELSMLRAQLLTNQVRRYATQSILLAFIALLAAAVKGPSGLYGEAAMSLVVKVVLVPVIVLKVLRVDEADLARSTRLRVSSMGYLGLVAAAFGFLVAGTIPVPLNSLMPSAVLGIAFAQVLVAFLVPVLRADVFSQAFGFFAFENAISLASVVLAPRIPIVVDAVLFFDLLVAAVVFGLLMRLHHRRSETLSTNVLDRLKG